ncbi:DUF2000 domain-containing protein [Rhizobium sp. XQZ8]|uniref:DUF2000 domain-containing protein n=1 Tax=Rhizobium populisoli TaxID=2859785 RepID=UPI001C68549D|nr:DUF2000 domain-containing protein [Rhizobium populisoli]MBW6424705.1 DUF2000 domain-containing protein [Rhizobium populisoli]
MNDDIRIAIIINPSLSLGLIANTVGVISIGLGARVPLLGATNLTDREGRITDTCCNRPVPILQADADTIRATMLRAASQPGERAVVVFPAFGRSMHDHSEYEKSLADRDLSREVIDGLGIVGPSKWVKSLTGSMKLLR